MDTSRGRNGIQLLLAAEQEAQQIVNAARNGWYKIGTTVLQTVEQGRQDLQGHLPSPWLLSWYSGKFAPKPKVPPPPKRENPAKDSICDECGEIGHWKRNSVEAIGAFYLCLPSGLEIVLNYCHYAPSITRGVISVSRLYEDGFVNRF
nr:V-type proton ATPase subunit G 1-like [Tanacetum cinerariifolium]